MFITPLIVRSKKFTIVASIHYSISEAHQVWHSLWRAQVSTLKLTAIASFTLSISHVEFSLFCLLFLLLLFFGIWWNDLVCKIHIDFVSNIFKGWANLLVKFVDWAKFSFTFYYWFCCWVNIFGLSNLFFEFRSVIFYGPFRFFFYESFLWFKGASLSLLSQIAKN